VGPGPSDGGEEFGHADAPVAPFLQDRDLELPLPVMAACWLTLNCCKRDK
jgi:hypothetical protein